MVKHKGLFFCLTFGSIRYKILKNQQKEGFAMNHEQVGDFLCKCDPQTVVEVTFRNFGGDSQQKIIGCGLANYGDSELHLNTKVNIVSLIEFDDIISLKIIPASEIVTLLRICEGITGKDLSACRSDATLNILNMLNQLLWLEKD